MSKALTTLVIVLFFNINLYSINYYLATNGNNSNDGKSTDKPFQTFTFAITKLIAEDTLFVSPGVYTNSTTISIKSSGNSDNRICVFALDNNQRPVLDFSAMAYGSSNRGISLSGSYWHMKGIRIKGAGDNGMNMTGSNNIIEFCDFFENHDSGLQLNGGAHDNKIINCDSYRNADFGSGISDNGGDADGFCPKMDVGSNNYFYGCRAWENTDDGWDGYLRGTNEVTTILENCWTWMNGYYWIDGYTNSSMNGNGFKQGGSDTKDLAHNFVVKNCLAFNNKANGFDQNSSTGSQTVFNCTSVANSGRSYYFNSSVSLPTEKVFNFSNCIAYNNSSTSFRTGTTFNTNNFACAISQFVSVDTVGVAAPRNSNGDLPEIEFMHLKSGSTLIDAGTEVGLPFVGMSPDLGCFEYNLSTKLELLSSKEEKEVISYIKNGHLIFNYQDLNIEIDSITLYDIHGKTLDHLSLHQTKLHNLQIDISAYKNKIILSRLTSNSGQFISKTIII